MNKRYLLIKESEIIYPGRGENGLLTSQNKTVIHDVYNRYKGYIDGVEYDKHGFQYGEEEPDYYSEHYTTDIITVVKTLTKEQYNEYKEVIESYNKI